MKLGTNILLGLGALSSLIAQRGFAQETQQVAANDPEGILRALEFSGYKAELTKDSVGDPLIKVEFAGYKSNVVFYDCDSITNDGCESLQLSTGFDRATPWNAEEAIKISSQFRFASVSLDEEGDPFVQWDIVTGNGIPSGVFLNAVRRYENGLEPIAEAVFEGDEDAQPSANVS